MESLSDKATFGQRQVGSEEVRHANIGAGVFQTHKCKGPGVSYAVHIQRTSGRPTWPKQSE